MLGAVSMSYSTTENATSARMLEERDSYAVRMAAEVARLSNETTELVKHCDMDVRCTHLPLITDWSVPAAPNGYRPQRYEALGEVLLTALDSNSRPNWDYALTLLARAAKGEPIAFEAQQLMQALCDRIGKQHAEVE